MKKEEQFLHSFNKDKVAYYDESIIELKIIEFETQLKNKLSKNDFKLYKVIIDNYKLLNNLKQKRLVKFILNQQKTHFK